MTYKQAIIKSKLEFIILWPLVFLGKIIALLSKTQKQYDYFLFFPQADIGGAAKVNIEITKLTSKHKNVLIIFTKNPQNNLFLDLFKLPNVDIIYLHKQIDNKYLHIVNIIYRGILAQRINSQKIKTIVFGGECMYFYKIILHLKKKISCIELSHLHFWLNYNQAFINRIDKRIFSTLALKKMVEEQYKNNSLSKRYFEKLCFIDNFIDIPPYTKINNERLEILFVGRGNAQKRVHLILSIAKYFREQSNVVHFSFVGDIEAIVDVKDFDYCTFYGKITDENKLKNLYQNSDVLILTSSFEGLPLVVMEMMTRGKVVLSTAVNGIPDYISDMQNGLLITETDEIKIIECGIEKIQFLIENPELRIQMGENAYHLASSKFSYELFLKNYQTVFDC